MLGFLPPYCLHEIVQAFVAREEGHRDDRYAYLMCVGLFVGTAGEGERACGPSEGVRIGSHAASAIPQPC